jgi:hypothetical protein
MTGEPSERQPLWLGQPGQHRSLCRSGLGRGSGNQFDDLTLNPGIVLRP